QIGQNVRGFRILVAPRRRLGKIISFHAYWTALKPWKDRRKINKMNRIRRILKKFFYFFLALIPIRQFSRTALSLDVEL
ncbi:unnamed protein product, partial [Hymenolepis diminuta]